MFQRWALGAGRARPLHHRRRDRPHRTPRIPGVETISHEYFKPLSITFDFTAMTNTIAP